MSLAAFTADDTLQPEPEIYESPIGMDRIDDDAVKVIRRLTQAGHQAYLVGGGVRDLLLDHRPKDFDVATSARPPEVRRLFRNCRVIGRRFRLAHVLFSGGKIIEVATFRRDPLNGPHHDTRVQNDDLLIRHDNVFGEPHEDATRRDFTINGLFYDLASAEVIDYVRGMPDLQARIVRTIGDPERRIREDPVRILRAIKFAARLTLNIDPELFDAIVGLRDEIQRSAKPRVLEEIFRLMRGGAAVRSIQLCWETGVLATVFPELAAFLDDDVRGREQTWARLACIDAAVAHDDVPSDLALLATLLLGAIQDALDGARHPRQVYEDFVGPIGVRLAMPRRLKDGLRAVTASQYPLQAGQVRKVAGRECFAEAVQVFIFDCAATDIPVPEWATAPDVLAELQDERRPKARRRRRRRR